jgi:hypothetical protein
VFRRRRYGDGLKVIPRGLNLAKTDTSRSEDKEFEMCTLQQRTGSETKKNNIILSFVFLYVDIHLILKAAELTGSRNNRLCVLLNSQEPISGTRLQLLSFPRKNIKLLKHVFETCLRLFAAAVHCNYGFWGINHVGHCLPQVRLSKTSSHCIFTLYMATEVLAETLDNSQHSTRLKLEAVLKSVWSRNPH